MTRIITLHDRAVWNDYVARHPEANAYQAFQWQTIVAEAYGCKTYALAAVNGSTPTSAGQPAALVGLLPLVHLKSLFFGNRLVSMPYFDHGGIIADNPEYEGALIQAAVALGHKLKARHLELRHLDKIASLNSVCMEGEQDREARATLENPALHDAWSLRSHKVRLLLSLPDSSEALMKGFKSKLRSQINRPTKAGLTAKIGGSELLDDFYNVFSINMRDLGSPVHAKALPRCVMTHFSKEARIVIVYSADEPVASALMLGFKDVMINPWSSALRRKSKDSPNMLLYWHMLAYAADHGFRYFDFGRSTPQEGTYFFKRQWGATPQPMYWYTHRLARSEGKAVYDQALPESKKRAYASALWRRFPIRLSRLVGPLIRKHIDL